MSHGGRKRHINEVRERARGESKSRTYVGGQHGVCLAYNAVGGLALLEVGAVHGVRGAEFVERLRRLVDLFVVRAYGWQG